MKTIDLYRGIDRATLTERINAASAFLMDNADVATKAAIVKTRVALDENGKPAKDKDGKEVMEDYILPEDALSVRIDILLGRLNHDLGASSAHPLTEDERKIRESELRTAVKHLNAFYLYEALDLVAALPFRNAVAMYMQDQTIDGYAVKYNQKDNVYHVINSSKTAQYLRPYDFFRTILADGELVAVLNGSKIIRDNFLHFYLVEVCKKDKEEPAIVNRFKWEAMPDAYKAIAEQMQWTEWNSKRKLRAQMTTFWKWLLGAECAPATANSADVGVMLQAVANVKDRANDSAALVESDAAFCVDLLFRTAWSNYNSRPYGLIRANDSSEITKVEPDGTILITTIKEAVAEKKGKK